MLSKLLLFRGNKRYMKVNIEFENNDIKEFLEFNDDGIKNIIDALQFKKYKQIICEIESGIIRPLRRGKYSINGVNMDDMTKENLMDAIVGAFESIIISHEEN
jgi:hypothetical protein